MHGVIAQVWSAPKCQPGAIAIASLPDVVADAWTESTGSTAGGQLTMRRDAWLTAGIALGRIIRLVSPARGVLEWVVAQIDDAAGAGASDAITVRCAPLRALLGLRGLVRSEPAGQTPVFTFTPAENRTPAQLLTSFVFVNLETDNLTWLSLGTVEPATPFTMPTFSAWTRGQVIAALEKETGARAVLRPLPHDTGYALDLLYDPGVTVPVTTLSLASGLARVQRARDAMRAPSILTALTANDAVIGASAWRVTAIAGAVLTLRDPDAISDATLGPVQADGQLVGAFVRATDGTTSQIMASSAAENTVTVASASGFAIGDQVTIAQDSAGTTLTRLVSPVGLAVTAPIAGLVRVPSARPERNILDDPVFDDLAGRWATVGAVQVDAWPITTEPATGALNGVVSSGAASITVDGFPSGYVVRRNQSLNVQSTVFTATADAVTSATGAVTVSVTPAVPTEIASGLPVTWAETDGGLFGGGAGTTNGVQSVGASSLVLQGMPPTPVFANGHRLIVEGLPNETTLVTALDTSIGDVTATIGPLTYDYPAGRPCALTELWIVDSSLGPMPATIVSEGTVAAAYTSGASTIALVMPTRFIVGARTFLSASLTVNGQGAQFLTVTGAATFGANRQATVSVSPATTWAIPANQNVSWERPGELDTLIRTVGVTSPGSSTITVVAGRSITRVVQAGDKITLSGARLYASATTTLTGGAGTIAIAPTAPSALPDNAVVVAEAPATWRPDLPGGSAVVRVWNTGGATARLESLPFTIPGSGAITYNVVIRAHWLVWTPQPSASFAFTTALLRTSDAAQLIVRNETATMVTTDVLDRVAVAAGTVLGQTSCKLAFYATGGDRPEFCFVKNAMVTLGADTSVPFTVGSFSNLAVRTALRALAEASAGARFRIEGAALPAVLSSIGEETAPIVIGQRVRLRVADFDVDVIVRVDQLTYSFTEPDRWSADLGGIPPRIATIDVTVS